MVVQGIAMIALMLGCVLGESVDERAALLDDGTRPALSRV